MEISLIIPVYNVEKGLYKCLDSILNQTFQDFEAILINDGSTDSSGDICDIYAQKDQRIKVIHQKNSGIGGARNTGLLAATGKYIAFSDPDDFIEPGMLEALYRSAETEQSQLVVCGYFKDEISNGIIVDRKVVCNFSGETFLERMVTLHKNTLLFMVWNKLFIRKIIETNHLQFSNMQLREDTVFLYAYCEHVDQISFVPTPYYHYLKYMNNTDRISATAKYMEHYYEKICLPLYEAGVALCSGRENDKDFAAFRQCVDNHYLSEIGGCLISNLAKSPLNPREKRQYIRYVLDDMVRKKPKIDWSCFRSLADKSIVCCLKLRFVEGIYFLQALYRKKFTRKARKY